MTVELRNGLYLSTGASAAFVDHATVLGLDIKVDLPFAARGAVSVTDVRIIDSLIGPLCLRIFIWHAVYSFSCPVPRQHSPGLGFAASGG